MPSLPHPRPPQCSTVGNCHNKLISYWQFSFNCQKLYQYASGFGSFPLLGAGLPKAGLNPLSYLHKCARFCHIALASLSCLTTLPLQVFLVLSNYLCRCAQFCDTDYTLSMPRPRLLHSPRVRHTQLYWGYTGHPRTRTRTLHTNHTLPGVTCQRKG